MGRSLKKIYFFFFISLSLFLGANIDSLKIALNNAKHDTTRCNILNMMVEMEGDDAVWPKYNYKLLKIAEKGLASNPSDALRVFYLKYQSYAYNNIGILANTRGDVETALLFYKKALKLQEEINDKLGIAGSLNNIGFLYNHQGDIVKALEFYHKCLALSEEINSKIGVSTALNNLGLIYVGQGDAVKGIEYYEKSLKICRETNDVEGIGTALNNIGAAYDVLNNMPKAVEYYTKGLEVYEKINDHRGISTGLNNIGMLHHNKNELNEALNYYLKALAIQQGSEDLSGVAYTSSNIANIKLKQGHTEEAIKYATLSLNTGLALGFPDNINKPAQILKLIYRKQNNYQKALEMYELEIKMRDSINNQETKRATIKKQFQYVYEKQAAQDSVKHAEAQKVTNAQLAAQEAQLNKERTQRIALYGGLILMLAGSGLVFNRFRLTQKQKKIIEQQKEQVGFAYDQLHAKNKEIMDSINYARRIQNSLMPTEKYISKVLNKKVK